MTIRPNPYVAGAPVSGSNFYGRRGDLSKVLESDNKLLRFAGTRRIGKTSFCYQIKHLCDTDPRYSHLVCLDWNLQGRTVDTARRRLLSRANRKRLDAVDWEQANSEELDCGSLIQVVCESYQDRPNTKTVLLLLDEPEMLQSAVTAERYEFLDNLKFAFDDVPNLRVVIVGSPRLPDFLVRPGYPYVLENFQTEFLREFSESEAQRLIHLAQQEAANPPAFLEGSEHVIDDIMSVSNKVPFFIQAICHAIFDGHPHNPPSQVIETLIERQLFSPFFTSDFNQLHPIQKIMVLNLANMNEPCEPDNLISAVKQVASRVLDQVPTLRHIDALSSLGLIRTSVDSRVQLANRLFDRWLRRDFENFWNEATQPVARDVAFVGEQMPHARLKRQELDEIRSSLGALEDGFAQLARDYTDTKVSESFYYQKRQGLVRERILMIGRLRDHLRDLEAGFFASVLDPFVLGAQEPEALWMALTKASAEARKMGWDDVVGSIIAERSQDPVQAALRAAFSLAEHLSR